MEKNVYDKYLTLKNSDQIASLFDMYIDMGEKIAGMQDRPGLIIEGPQIAKIAKM